MGSEHGLSRKIRKYTDHVMFGRASLTSFLTLTPSTGEDWKVDALDEEALRRKVANVVEAQQRLHRVVEEPVKEYRDKPRQAASRGQLPNFAVGDYVMVARVRRPDLTPKLVSTWTGLGRIVTVDKVHVYGVQNIVTGEVEDVHVVRLRFYTDKDLEMTAAFKEMFQHAVTQGEFEMAGMSTFWRPKTDRILTPRRTRLDSTRERVWAPLAAIWDGAPQRCRVGHM